MNGPPQTGRGGAVPTALANLARPGPEERELIADIARFANDPLGFVLYVFPWGKAGSRLYDQPGPDVWQVDVLTALSEALHAGEKVGEAAATAIKIAVASGHGIGKTALVAWIILWFVSCHEFPQVVVTANTRTQLLTKTWRELAKWHRMSLNKHWFEWTATQFKHVVYPDTWFASAIPWSAHSSEAFAGTHEKFVLMVFDEASRIDNAIWEVAEGAMTTNGAIWIAFGNPTQNTGKFAECFGRQKHRWITRQVDSRKARMANKAQIQQWVDDYGEDSDFVRVRVRGVFPRAGSMQFIAGDVVLASMSRDIEAYEGAARVMGVDVARHGDDQSCILKRQGLKVWPIKRHRITDLMLLASVVAAEIVEFKPHAVFIDVTGMGWGVYDRLVQLGHSAVCIPVQVGEASVEPQKYHNRRAELWTKGRDWIVAGGCLPEDVELEADLTGIEFGYDDRERTQMEKKEDMKKRGLASPDSADALMLTFANHIEPPPDTKDPTDQAMARLARMRAKINRGGDTTPQSARPYAVRRDPDRPSARVLRQRRAAAHAFRLVESARGPLHARRATRAEVHLDGLWADGARPNRRAAARALRSTPVRGVVGKGGC